MSRCRRELQQLPKPQLIGRWAQRQRLGIQPMQLVTKLIGRTAEKRLQQAFLSPGSTRATRARAGVLKRTGRELLADQSAASWPAPTHHAGHLWRRPRCGGHKKAIKLLGIDGKHLRNPFSRTEHFSTMAPRGIAMATATWLGTPPATWRNQVANWARLAPSCGTTRSPTRRRCRSRT